MLENRLSFLRTMTWICLLALLPYCAVWVYDKRYLFIVYGLVSAIPLMLNFYLLPRKHFALAGLNIFFFGLLNIFIYDDGIGGGNGFYYFFFTELISIFILLENKERAYKIVAMISLLLVMILTNIDGFSPKLHSSFPIMAPSISKLATLNFIIALACTVGQLLFMLRAIRKAEQSYLDLIQKSEELAETKSQFLSNMSHELRTPMNAVIGLSDMLIRENPTAGQRKHLDALRFSSYHLLHVINDILDYSRIEAGKVELETSDFDLIALLNNLQLSLNPLAAKKNLDLIFDIDSNLPQFVSGDANRLTQVLNNLINNGIKFTDKGWVRVQVIVLKFDEVNLSIKFLITDTGIGIDADKTGMIFERFTQASADTTKKFGGTGLGLAICNKILLLQNSKIIVDSSPGEGSVFSFELNFKKAAAIPSFKLKLENGNSLLKGLHVLLAEDNEINQLVARNYLESWEVNLKIVNNGLEAVEYVGGHKVDIILMDLQMPEMDGYQATREIREMHNGRYSYLPIIAVTASSQYEVGEQYRRSGMNDFVHKPFNPDDLYAKMVSYFVTQN